MFLMDEIKKGEKVDSTELAYMVYLKVNNYHNHLFIPDEMHATPEEIESLPTLLRLLAEDIERQEHKMKEEMPARRKRSSMNARER